ncbi:Uncharacterised protein [Mycobacteroides abscessus subsp. abscessus]|nr:Uncharacterised protein [Mycobacteroides abscessus subsp. abscessus]SKU06065.1 Uncharacterised protein [Mycobacteroides abscessus subsp. abscessus]
MSTNALYASAKAHIGAANMASEPTATSAWRLGYPGYAAMIAS